MKHSEVERQEAIARLKEWLKPGDTIHCILRHVSRSGMLRVIQLVKLESGQMHPYAEYIGWRAASVLELKYDPDREGIRVSGCGMDMGFHLVYNLSRTLWPLGFGCIGKNCPSNDHSNGDRDYTPDRKGILPGGERKRHCHKDGGYALRHRWL